MEQERKIYTLAELGKSLRAVIERTYHASYWIKAEIARLNHYPRSGHCYPELVDKSGNVIQAQMRANLWASDFKHINKQFLDITGEPLREGMMILFRASLSFHPVHGFSLQIQEIEPTFTLGEMAMEKIRGLERLKKEGIYQQNKSLSLALLPKRLAIISVETSKGYHDFLNIIQPKPAGYAIWHYLFPALLQGDRAVESILSQLRIIRKLVNRFDMVAIIRGGGGDIGLSCYDNYHLAREVALFPLPVITGIGHSTNETLTEMVAWANKITPTDVGYFVLERYRDFEQRLQGAAQQLVRQGNLMISAQQQGLNSSSERLLRATPERHKQAAVHIQGFSQALTSHARNLCQGQRERLFQNALNVSLRPSHLIAGFKAQLEQKHTLLGHQLVRNLEQQGNRLDYLAEKMKLLNPVHVLQRGYSITSLNGKPVGHTSQLKNGDTIQTQFSDGVISSIVS